MTSLFEGHAASWTFPDRDSRDLLDTIVHPPEDHDRDVLRCRTGGVKTWMIVQADVIKIDYHGIESSLDIGEVEYHATVAHVLGSHLDLDIPPVSV
jgi:hypothetical protein